MVLMPVEVIKQACYVWFGRPKVVRLGGVGKDKVITWEYKKLVNLSIFLCGVYKIIYFCTGNVSLKTIKSGGNAINSAYYHDKSYFSK